MTFKEKLRLEHHMEPLSLGEAVCPRNYGYEDNCPCNADLEMDCGACWDREMPEETQEEAVARVVEAFDDAMGRPSSTIKDSGDRTQFETGAVRDMREGKGRCDLMPLHVLGEFFKDGVFTHLAHFLEDTTKTDHLYACLSMAWHRWDSKQTMFLEVAKHFEEGAKKYGENNWQKGIPTHCYIDSAVRHYLKWKRGDKDEPHDRAFVWNLMCCIWEVDYHKTTVEGTEA